MVMNSSLVPFFTGNYQPDLLVTIENYLYNEFIIINGRIKNVGYAEMCSFVLNNIKDLLSLAVSKKAKALRIITNANFLIAFDLTNTILNKEDTIKFNCIYRAYIINPEKNVIYNTKSVELLYILALKFNKDLVQQLKDIGLEEKIALLLAINKHSSTDERKNIKRMIRAIQKFPPSIMTEQMIINIFYKTYSNQVTNLFIAIMTDKFDLFNTEAEKYVYSTVSNAILDILNSLDTDDIKEIIIKYEEELNSMGLHGRFSLHCINSGDYENICNVVSHLTASGYYVK